MPPYYVGETPSIGTTQTGGRSILKAGHDTSRRRVDTLWKLSLVVFLFTALLITSLLVGYVSLSGRSVVLVGGNSRISISASGVTGSPPNVAPLYLGGQPARGSTLIAGDCTSGDSQAVWVGRIEIRLWKCH